MADRPTRRDLPVTRRQVLTLGAAGLGLAGLGLAAPAAPLSAAPPTLGTTPRVLAQAAPILDPSIRRFRLPVELVIEAYEQESRVEIGNQQGDIHLAMFYDYNCPRCRVIHGPLADWIMRDGDIKLVMLTWPVLSPQSEEAACVAAALKRQVPEENYLAFHRQLLATRGMVDGKRALEVGKLHVPDAARLEREAKSAPIIAEVKACLSLGDRLGFTGTPAYILSNEALVGDIPIDGFEKLAAALRRCDRLDCSETD
jgi:protein-disulfide isomerase